MDSRKRENLNILKRVGLEERVHIHKRLIRPATAVHLRCVAQDEFEPIRDPHQPMELSRGTSPLQKEWAHMEAPLLQGMKKAVLMKGERAIGGSVLRSAPGGRTQSFHLDYEPRRMNEEIEAGGSRPRTLLVALSEECTVYLLGSRDEVVEVRMRMGDGICFGGSVWHAAAGSDSVNYRAHWYLEPAKLLSSHKTLRSARVVFETSAREVEDPDHVFQLHN